MQAVFLFHGEPYMSNIFASLFVDFEPELIQAALGVAIATEEAEITAQAVAAQKANPTATAAQLQPIVFGDITHNVIRPKIGFLTDILVNEPAYINQVTPLIQAAIAGLTGVPAS